jgi:hypothetical protein
MFAIVRNNEIVKTAIRGTSLVLDDYDYGPKWQESIPLGTLGLMEVVETTRPDERFWWIAEQLVVEDGVPKRVYTTTPKDLDQLKAQWTATFKEQANKELASTDWMIIRKFERNIDVPQDVAASRQQIIDNCNQVEQAIQASTTVEELIQAIQ